MFIHVRVLAVASTIFLLVASATALNTPWNAGEYRNAGVVVPRTVARSGQEPSPRKPTPPPPSKNEPGSQGGNPSARWEGIVVRSSSEKSTLDVRKRGGNIEKTVHYDSSTKWTSQEHGSKTFNNITAADVKDGDRVICLGKYDEKGEFHATVISKRLTR